MTTFEVCKLCKQKKPVSFSFEDLLTGKLSVSDTLTKLADGVYVCIGHKLTDAEKVKLKSEATK